MNSSLEHTGPAGIHVVRQRDYSAEGERDTGRQDRGGWRWLREQEWKANVVPHNQVEFFLTSLLEYNCYTIVCSFLLYNKVNQLYIYIYPHISSLWRLPPMLTWCYNFLYSPDGPVPSPCPQVHSLRLRLYSCPAPRFFRTIFFFLDCHKILWRF